MNREIKFRAWSNRDKCWCGAFAVHKSGLWRESPNNEWTDLSQQSEMVLMQFTGLLDKNGKEIYEGDIVKYTNHSDELNILIEEVKTKRFVNGFMPFNYALDMDYTTLEVIGNIFENSDLIK